MEKNCESQSIESKLAYLPESAAPPRKNGELVFEEPWERRSFGMTLALYEEKHYSSWDDFRTRLIQEIAKWESSENKDKDWHYYEHWLAALERLVVETGMLDKHEIDARTKEFLSGERDEFF